MSILSPDHEERVRLKQHIRDAERMARDAEQTARLWWEKAKEWKKALATLEGP